MVDALSGLHVPGGHVAAQAPLVLPVITSRNNPSSSPSAPGAHEHRAVVSCGGRPDLAGRALGQVRALTLLLVGERDEQVLDLNRRAAVELGAPAELEVVLGATHLFGEPGALEHVTRSTPRLVQLASGRGNLMALTVALAGDAMLNRGVATRLAEAGPRSVVADEVRDITAAADLFVAAPTRLVRQGHQDALALAMLSCGPIELLLPHEQPHDRSPG